MYLNHALYSGHKEMVLQDRPYVCSNVIPAELKSSLVLASSLVVPVTEKFQNVPKVYKHTWSLEEV